MFTYVDAVVRINDQWKDIDITGIELADLIKNTDEVVVELQHSMSSIPSILNFKDVLNQLETLTVDVVEWLESIGEQALPVLDGKISNYPTLHLVTRDVADGDYTILRGDKNYLGNPAEYDAPINSRDLIIQKEGMDYAHAEKNYLVTVNGLIHPMVPTEYGMYVLDGNHSVTLSNRNQSSILDFSKLGGIDVVDIRPEYITPVDGSNILNGFYIKLPISMAKVTPLLVLGGFLHAVDGTYQQVNAHTLRVDIKNYPLFTRLVRGAQQVEYGDLDILKDDRSVTRDIVSEETLLKFLESMFSFVVIVKNSHIETQDIPVISTPTAGVFETEVVPYGILTNSDGTLAEFLIIKHGDRYELSSDRVIPGDYRYDTTSMEFNTVNLSQDLPTEYSGKRCTLKQLIARNI